MRPRQRILRHHTTNTVLIASCLLPLLASSLPDHVRRSSTSSSVSVFGEPSSSSSSFSNNPSTAAHRGVFYPPSTSLNVSLWPMPRGMSIGTGNITVDSNTFLFVYDSSSSSHSSSSSPSSSIDILNSAFIRYYTIIFGSSSASSQATTSSSSSSSSALQSLSVSLISLDDALQLGTNESYTLQIDSSSNATLSCQTVYGCLRGLETFSQLILRTTTTSPTTAPSTYFIQGVPLYIFDEPRFPHRGLLVDTSRHFLPMTTIETIVDGLSYDKFNTLHLHLTDVQSFPYLSKAVPELSQGAWSSTQIHSTTDLANLVTYSKYRGVRVMVELDNPAHSFSWSIGRPDIVIPCPLNPYNSVLDPTTEATYDVLLALFTELSSIFTEDMIHIGGDEIDITNTTSCYNASHVNTWMMTQNITAGDYKAVARYHLQRVQDIVINTLGKTMGVWEEVLDHYGPGMINPTPIPSFLNASETVVFMWFCPCWEWFNMSYITQQGFRGVKTDDYYLDNPASWETYYTADPLTNAACTYIPNNNTTSSTRGKTGDNSGYWANCTCSTPSGCFNITAPEQVELVIGGEAAMWGEEVDESNFFQQVWPRLSGVGERLWTNVYVNDPVEALPRLIDHRCRLRGRGISSPPLVPGYCDGTRS